MRKLEAVLPKELKKKAPFFYLETNLFCLLPQPQLQSSLPPSIKLLFSAWTLLKFNRMAWRRSPSLPPLAKSLSLATGEHIWQDEPRLRGQHARRRAGKEFTHALLRSAPGKLLPLGWKQGRVKETTASGGQLPGPRAAPAERGWQPRPV